MMKYAFAIMAAFDGALAMHDITVHDPSWQTWVLAGMGIYFGLRSLQSEVTVQTNIGGTVIKGDKP